MNKFLKPINTFLIIAGVVASVGAVKSVEAAPRQLVVVVADGLSPQTVEFGTSYVKKAFEIEADTGIDKLKSKTNLTVQSEDSLKGVLETAAKNGYKTGFVTSGEVTKAISPYINLPAESDVAKTLIENSKLDFVAGGGRAYFVSNKIPGSKRNDDADLFKTLSAAGGTSYLNVESLDDEAKGRTFVLQSEGELSYALDREAESQAGLDELVILAVDTLVGENDSPFVLVIHDTLLAKALAAKDSPAALEQYHLLDTIIDDLQTRQEDNPDLAVALVARSGTIAPRFTTDQIAERNNSIFVLTNLPKSYSQAGAYLKGANEEAISEFATEIYKGWKISSDEKRGIISGTLEPEVAIRSSYEPVVKIGYESVSAPVTFYASGIASLDEVANVSTTKPGPSSKPASEAVAVLP